MNTSRPDLADEVFGPNYDYRYAAEQKENGNPSIVAEMGYVALHYLKVIPGRIKERIKRAWRAGMNDDDYQGSLDELGFSTEAEAPHLFSGEPQHHAATPATPETPVAAPYIPAQRQPSPDEMFVADAADRARAVLEAPTEKLHLVPPPEESSGRHVRSDNEPPTFQATSTRPRGAHRRPDPDETTEFPRAA